MPSPRALWSSDDWTAPEGAVVRAIPAADGTLLRVASWPAPRPSGPGTVLILQGRAEFIEKYYEVVAELLRRGFAVVAFDWRGQGQSARSLPHGHKGHVGAFSEFALDLDTVAAKILPDCPRPVVALAHSMGGCIALAHAAGGTLPADRLVAIAPMVGLSMVRRPGLVRLAARALFRLGFGTRAVPGGSPRSVSTLPFDGNRLTGDAARYSRASAVATALGEAAIGAPTVGWLDAAYTAMRALAGAGARLRVPTLIVAAGDDPVCSTPDIVRFAAPLGPDGLVVIPNARHEILMETDEVRTAFWRAFDRFAGVSGAGREAGEDLVVQPGVA